MIEDLGVFLVAHESGFFGHHSVHVQNKLSAARVYKVADLRVGQGENAVRIDGDGAPIQLKDRRAWLVSNLKFEAVIPQPSNMMIGSDSGINSYVYTIAPAQIGVDRGDPLVIALAGLVIHRVDAIRHNDDRVLNLMQDVLHTIGPPLSALGDLREVPVGNRRKSAGGIEQGCVSGGNNSRAGVPVAIR